MKGSRVQFLEQTLSTLRYEMAYKALNLVKDEMCKEKGYKRMNGTHYYFHLVDVTQKLLNAGVRDENIITASLLHDLVEDVVDEYKNPKYSIEDISQMFNQEVALMVDLVTKRNDVDYKEDTQELENYLNRISEHVGASLIKCSDRVHNFGTLLDATTEKQYEKAIETETFYFPFFKKCRKLHPWYSYFFFDAKTTIEPHLHQIKAHYLEVQALKKEIKKLKKNKK
jgi:GTP pyrophosphokinase